MTETEREREGRKKERGRERGRWIDRRCLFKRVVMFGTVGVPESLMACTSHTVQPFASLKLGQNSHL